LEGLVYAPSCSCFTTFADIPRIQLRLKRISRSLQNRHRPLPAQASSWTSSLPSFQQSSSQAFPASYHE